jgi:threonine/homoserine/homoserine lactone efflux protein
VSDDLLAPIVAGGAAGYAIAIPVGPIAVLIVDGGIRHGVRHALSAAAGVASADGLYALAAVIGGSAIARLLAPVSGALQIVSAVVLAGVGLMLIRNALRAVPGAPAEEPPGSRRTFVKFLGLTIVNPSTAIYFGSLVLGLPSVAHGTAAQRTAFVLAAFLASLSWQVLLALTGGLMRHRLPDRALRVTGVAGGILVLVLAATIAF